MVAQQDQQDIFGLVSKAQCSPSAGQGRKEDRSPGRVGRPKKYHEAAYLGEPFLGAVISNGLVGETISCIWK